MKQYSTNKKKDEILEKQDKRVGKARGREWYQKKKKVEPVFEGRTKQVRLGPSQARYVARDRTD